jgi:polyphosphate glucokinase
MPSVKNNPNVVLGVDIGGSGVKGGLVDLARGELLGDRVRLETPNPCTPAALGDAVCSIVRNFEWRGLLGCGFPGVILKGRIMSAANLDESLIGVDLAHLLHDRTGCATHVINDADAAGLAEVTYGAGKGRDGVVLLITVGTGLGSGLFFNGQLVPNSELGHVKMKDKDSGKVLDAEKLASDRAREKNDLSWSEWAGRFDRYLKYLHRVLWPELIIIGGGVAKKGDKFMPLLTVPCATALAALGSNAGIVGAATAAKINLGKK